MRTALIGLVRLLLEADLLRRELRLMFDALERGREVLEVLGGGQELVQDCRGVSRQ